MTETNWATGEAELWLDNDEYAYHEARRIVKNVTRGTARSLRVLLRRIVPDDSYGVIEQIDTIDWDHVIARIKEDIEEGYE